MKNQNVQISKVCGLCAGCQFAVNTAISALKKNKNVTLFKEIVHNKNVNELLKQKGINIESNLQNLTKNSLVVLRAHGEPMQTYEHLKNNGIEFVDCTCVNVKKIHDLVHEKSTDNIVVIIGKYGKKNGVMHPEIAGTVGWCKTKPILIEDEDDLNQLKTLKNQNFYLVCQTTFNIEKADNLISQIQQICISNNCKIEVNKSICMAQKQINVFSTELAKNCDIMFVVGGKNSSNTTELFNNVKNFTNAFFIENINDWKNVLASNNITLTKNLKIGWTAGASTMREDLADLKKQIETELEENLWTV